jgi:hypothetical protein
MRPYLGTLFLFYLVMNLELLENDDNLAINNKNSLLAKFDIIFEPMTLWW